MAYFIDNDGIAKEVYFTPRLVAKGDEPSGQIVINENGTHDVKAYAEAIVNVVGGEDPAPVLDSVFSNNDWTSIIWACQNNAVPDTWAVGDEKTMQIGENEVVVAICGKNHDEYADGGLAPLTFIQKKAFMSAPINEKAQSDASYGKLYNTPYTETDMYKITLPSVIEMMPEDVKNGLRAVKKKNTIDGVRTAFFDTADKVWLFSEGEVGGSWNNFEDGKKYEYAFGGCTDEDGVTDISFFTRSYSSSNYFVVYACDSLTGMGTASDNDQNRPLSVVFGFCF